MKMKYVDFVPVTAGAIVAATLATLAKTAQTPISLYAAGAIGVIVLGKILGLRYVGSISELTGLRPASINVQLCASLLAWAFILAVTYGDGGGNVQP